ncbi:ABC-type transport auxiliary lipoprotein family protein [Pandoraea sp. XY-2]|uniref:ABC-type transport auxiliary lipoprotein family protein n=1 Tax=Pandoraea sp. XY-2 TaxID=2518599 RepID=UPI00101B14B5|nr:ABC-type transport auxiliary lipoprotein family protein [Pandoraea sp. XY-2]QBC30416.1 ABC transporter [Pandoraea sp. XY-2]
MRNTVMQGDIEMIEPIDAVNANEVAVAPRGGERARALAAGWLCAAAVVLVAGCAAPAPSASLTRFDLGPPTIPAASANVAANARDTSANTAANTAAPASDVAATGGLRMSPLKVVVNAPSWLDVDTIYYRLPSSDGDQARGYANSRWLASPARLFGDRLRAALSVDRPVLAAGDPTAAPALRVEIEEFAQYFDSASTSHGVVQVRATLFDGPKLLAQTTLRAQAPAASADAAGGTRALAAASDAVQTQLIQWLAGRVPAPSATAGTAARARPSLPAASSAPGATAR